MGTYKLFGRTITFADDAERCFDYQERLWKARTAAETEFVSWYKKCGNIRTVLTSYPKTAMMLVSKHAIDPLYEDLSKIGIYDMTKDNFIEECGDYENFADAFDEVRDYYNSIIDQLEAAIEYREERKESRGRVIGGGFGLSGAVKGMATAGAMNAISGAGHSIANAIGNAKSESDAKAAQKRLYECDETLYILADAIKNDILFVYNAFMTYINDIKGPYISNVFYQDKADALFENAKKLPQKRIDLLCEAFEYCPWDIDVLSYIFLNYQEERKNVWDISKRFHVDLHKTAEEAFSNMYTASAKNSEEKAQEVKKEILDQMHQLGITVSGTVDRIERDGVSRILAGYNTATEETLQKMLAAVDVYDASERNKSVIIHDKGVWELAKKYRVSFSPEESEAILSQVYTPVAQKYEDQAQIAKVKIKTIMQALGLKDSKTFNKLESDCLARLCPGYQTANEATCNEMLKKIKAYDALDKNKQPFVSKIKTRIEAIWSAEDGEIFDNVYLNTNIHNAEEVKKAIAFVNAKKRTASAGKYLSALSGCNEENIKKARQFQQSTTKLAMYTGFGLIALGIILLFMDLGFVLSLAVAAIGTVLLVYYYGLKKAWNLLTLCGTLVHPQISAPIQTGTVQVKNASEEQHQEMDNSLE